MSSFYIATSVTRHREHNIVRDFLEMHGHILTYDWTTENNGGDLRGVPLDVQARIGAEEMRGIAEADFVVVLLPGGFGTHAEIGAAYITSKPTFIHSIDPDHFSNDPDTGKVKNFYLGPYTTRFVHTDIAVAVHRILAWWDATETPLGNRRTPAYLEHLEHDTPCEDCPIGGRWNPEQGDQEATCSRVPLCEWRGAIQ